MTRSASTRPSAHGEVKRQEPQEVKKETIHDCSRERPLPTSQAHAAEHERLQIHQRRGRVIYNPEASLSKPYGTVHI